MTRTWYLRLLASAQTSVLSHGSFLHAYEDTLYKTRLLDSPNLEAILLILDSPNTTMSLRFTAFENSFDPSSACQPWGSEKVSMDDTSGASDVLDNNVAWQPA